MRDIGMEPFDYGKKAAQLALDKKLHRVRSPVGGANDGPAGKIGMVIAQKPD
jgi:hypothetical protein